MQKRSKSRAPTALASSTSLAQQNGLSGVYNVGVSGSSRPSEAARTEIERPTSDGTAAAEKKQPLTEPRASRHPNAAATKPKAHDIVKGHSLRCLPTINITGCCHGQDVASQPALPAPTYQQRRPEDRRILKDPKGGETLIMELPTACSTGPRARTVPPGPRPSASLRDPWILRLAGMTLA
jgi:hypothetical protein